MRGLRAAGLIVALALAAAGCDMLQLETREYLRTNPGVALETGTSGSFAGYELLEENLRGASVLFTGEAHGSRERTQWSPFTRSTTNPWLSTARGVIQGSNRLQPALSGLPATRIAPTISVILRSLEPP
mgnify:FL=1